MLQQEPAVATTPSLERSYTGTAEHHETLAEKLLQRKDLNDIETPSDHVITPFPLGV